MPKQKLPSLSQLKDLMKKLAIKNGIPKQVNNTWRHSIIVWRFAHKIAKSAIKNGYSINLKLLKIACFSHDIGRMITGSKGSKVLKPAIFHFYEGYWLMKKLGYLKLARYCISHAAGSGLDRNINKKFGFIAKDFFPKTIEEKILAYADCRTNYKKGVGPFTDTFEYSYNRFKRYPGVDNRLKKIINL